MNNKKEGEYYSQMVRLFRNEYGGKDLQTFCVKEKVSYTKMLHCLRGDSYRKPQRTIPLSKSEDTGLHPLVVEQPLEVMSPESAAAVSHASCPDTRQPSPHLVEISLRSGIRVSVHDCDTASLLVMIREMEGMSC